jgi:phytoene desaturase
MDTALVAGAGFGGLAAALRLRARGLSVTVIDVLPGPGGRGREWVREGTGKRLRYDAGPTVLTAPLLFEELFTLFGEHLSDHVKLLPVKPWYQMRFTDGTHLNYGGSTAEIQAEIARLSPLDAAAYPDFLEHSKRLFEKGYEELGSQAFLSTASMLPVLPAMARLRADRSVYDLTSQFFVDERIRRAFSIQPLLVGGNPFDTTSIYSLIHYLERKWGVWFPAGGMARLVDALVALAKRQGIKFVWGNGVKQLQVENARVKGALLQDGTSLQADVVVANADPGHVLTHWLAQPRKFGWLRQDALQAKEYSMGLFVWYFSTRRVYSQVPHHTILFGQAYREVLNSIFKTQQLTEDLSIYLHRPTATDPSYAPSGHDSFYALVPVPNLRADIDWQQEAPRLRTRLLQALEKRILPDLAQEIVDEFHVTPTYFRDALNAPWGSGFSITPKLTQSAGFRFPNRDPQLENLYFVGAGSHPGAGVPGVVTSAKVVERLMYGSVT